MNSNFNQPIFIVGIPRSGTSIIAGMLGICGVWYGQTLSATGANPVGFFENRNLRNHVIKPILKRLNCDTLGVRSLPALESLQPIPNLAEVIFALISNEGYSNIYPWLFKEPKLSLIWPIFMHSFPKARWVIVRRNSSDIVRSCLETDFMAQHSSDPLFWESFVNNYLERLSRLKVNIDFYREIWPDDLVNGSFGSAQALVHDLGLNWREEEITDFINKDYWHS
jgi:hypothetical protein